MTIHHGDAKALLKQLTVEQRPDVVYLDPMFPDRGNTAKVKQDMQGISCGCGCG
jgi:16S rRNA (guanine1516-N2)-methyltransferase